MSGLYDLLFGMDAVAVILMSPFLPRRADKFPRFRDVKIRASEGSGPEIGVFTRMGGENMKCSAQGAEDCPCSGCDARRLQRAENFREYVDDGDYAFFVFGIPEERRPDFEAVGNGGKPSDWYVGRLRAMFSLPEDGPKTRAFIEMVCTGVSGEAAP